MKKVISFSIYGNLPKYTIGLLKNLDLSKQIYPGWDVYVYYNNTVPTEIIEKCKQYNHVTLFDMTEFSGPGMFWRFLPYENVERFISRDSDSRLNMREKSAVDEWIRSNKALHIMRDHRHHETLIYGGMFGLVIKPEINLKKDIIEWIIKSNTSLFERIEDIKFLEDYLYKRYINNGDMLCHQSIDWSQFPFSKPFPTKMEDYHFVGEVFDENDERHEDFLWWADKKEFGYNSLLIKL